MDVYFVESKGVDLPDPVYKIVDSGFPRAGWNSRAGIVANEVCTSSGSANYVRTEFYSHPSHNVITVAGMNQGDPSISFAEGGIFYTKNADDVVSVFPLMRELVNLFEYYYAVTERVNSEFSKIGRHFGKQIKTPDYPSRVNNIRGWRGGITHSGDIAMRIDFFDGQIRRNQHSVREYFESAIKELCSWIDECYKLCLSAL